MIWYRSHKTAEEMDREFGEAMIDEAVGEAIDEAMIGEAVGEAMIGGDDW